MIGKLATTLRYMHLSPSSLHDAIGLLNDRGGRGEMGESKGPQKGNQN